MDILLISDHDLTSVKIREVLLKEGLNLPVAQVVTLDLAAERLAQVQPDLLFIVLEPDPERALATLATLPIQERTRVLGVGPAANSKLVLRTLRAGADDYVDEQDLEGELKPALVRYHAEMTAHEEVGRLIVVLAPSGGSGSSTVAANIATVLAKEHKQVGLVDLKLETGDLAALLDLKPTYSLADLCLNSARLDRVLFERSLTRHSSGVHLLGPPERLADVEHVRPEGVRQVLTLARTAFPYVVVDLDHSFRNDQPKILNQADIILLVLRLDFASLRNTRRTLEHLDQMGIPRDRVRLVVNRYGQPKEVPAAKVEEALGMKIFHYVPDDPKTVNRANNNGIPMVLESPSAKVSKSLATLAANVNGRHKTH